MLIESAIDIGLLELFHLHFQFIIMHTVGHRVTMAFLVVQPSQIGLTIHQQ